MLSSYQLIDKAVRAGVSQLLYASSEAFMEWKREESNRRLGISSISTCKTKICAERIFLSYKDKIDVKCIRPATVCGYSPGWTRCESVNLLTFQAKKQSITVFEGSRQGLTYTSWIWLMSIDIFLKIKIFQADVLMRDLKILVSWYPFVS